MSNPTEDRKLANPNYQEKSATGLANGIQKAFNK
jgi:N-acetylmuramoyl-L-alanine amidase